MNKLGDLVVNLNSQVTDIQKVNLGIPSPISEDDSPLNLINIWFNSADHISALSKESKSKIEKYLLTINPITTNSRKYYKSVGRPTLYRGLHNKNKANLKVDVTKYTIGSIIEGHLDSWTTDLLVAKRYADKSSDGVILQYYPDIDDILLVDTIVHTNKYYLAKEEYLLKSLDFKVVDETLIDDDIKLLVLSRLTDTVSTLE